MHIDLFGNSKLDNQQIELELTCILILNIYLQTLCKILALSFMFIKL